MQAENTKNLITAVRLRQIPSLFLCFAIGFLGALTFKTAYLEILQVEYSATNFLASKIVFLILFVIGFVLKKILSEKFMNILETSLVLLLSIEMFFILFFSSRLIQVDYIFYTDYFLFFTALNSLVTGILTSNFKQFRLWFFLTGGVVFTAYLLFNPEIKLKPENYLMPLLFVLTLELCIFTLWQKKNSLVDKKNKFRTNEINDSYYYAFVSLFIFHTLQYYSSISEPDSFILGAGLGLLLFNIAYHYELFRKEIKWRFLSARFVLFLSLILSLHESKFQVFSSYLLFIDAAMISFFRPFKYDYSKILFSVIGGIITFIISVYLETVYTKYEYKFGLIFLFILVNLIYILVLKRIRLFNKTILFFASILFSIYLYTPKPFNTELVTQNEQILKPSPYLFLPFELNSMEYVFHNTNLPFDNIETLPKKNDFDKKTIVLGLEKRPEVILTYIVHLYKNKYNFILFTNDSKLNLESKIKFLYKKEFPLFQVYIPDYFKEKFPELKKESWEVELIESRIKNQTDYKAISESIQNLFLYSSGTIYEAVKEYNKKFFNSYKNYTKYFYSKENYEDSISAAKFALLHSEDDEILEITFQAIMRITPDISHIPVMKTLLKKNKYKEEVSKRLYPLYLSLNEKENALIIIDELTNYYNSMGGEESLTEIKNLKIEKAKIYLQVSNIRGAEEIILNEIRKEPDSVVWQKLKTDLIALRENTFRVYTNPAKKENQVGRSLE